MGLFRDITDQLKTLPDWVKWTTGLFGGIGVLVVSFQREPKILFLSAIILVLVVSVVTMGVVILSKDASRLGGKPMFRYPRLRRAMLIFDAIFLLALSFCLMFASSRAWLSNVFVPARLIADIVIVELDGKNRTDFEIGHRIQDDLERRLRTYGLADEVVVLLSDSSVRDRQTVQRLANVYRAKAVVWGWQDALGITVNVSLIDKDRIAQTPSVVDRPLKTNDGRLVNTSVLIRDQLPRSVSFLSLFILGHVFYEGNRGALGRSAYDAAMNTLPDTTIEENQAIVSYFQARRLQYLNARPRDGISANTIGAPTTDSIGNSSEQHRDSAVSLARVDREHLDRVVCLYVDAIQREPTFYEAYNNLGVVMSDVRSDLAWLSPQAGRCLNSIGMGSFTAAQLFQRAARLNPRSSIVRYNILAEEWKNHAWEYSDVRNRRPSFNSPALERELTKLVASDSSIGGAYIVLGLIAFDRGELELAKNRLERASRLDPRNARVLTNLGQTYLRRGEMARARSHFEAAIRLNPLDVEAHLALAGMLVKRSDPSARQHLSNVLRADSGLYSLTKVLESELLYREGRPEEAEQTLRQLVRPPKCQTDASACEWGGDEPQYAVYLLYLLSQLNHSSLPISDRVFERSGSLLPLYPALTNSTLELAWYDLVDRCVSTEEEVRILGGEAQRPAATGRSPLEWGTSNACIPTRLVDRVADAYQAMSTWLPYRMYYRVRPPAHTMECPFVYLSGYARPDREFAGTILTSREGRAREGVSRLRLSRFSGSVVVREVEPEVSHLDALWMEVTFANGAKARLLPEIHALHERDGQYVTLLQGGELQVRFDLPNGWKPQEIWLVSIGYYERLPSLDSQRRKDKQ